MSIKRPCAYPGCPRLVRKGYCAEHKKASRKRYDDLRGSARDRGYDATWDKVSKQYRKMHPLCEDCVAEDRTTPAELVHHIVPLDEGGAKYDYANLRALCRSCHETVHGKEAA